MTSLYDTQVCCGATIGLIQLYCQDCLLRHDERQFDMHCVQLSIFNIALTHIVG